MIVADQAPDGDGGDVGHGDDDSDGNDGSNQVPFIYMLICAHEGLNKFSTCDRCGAIIKSYYTLVLRVFIPGFLFNPCLEMTAIIDRLYSHLLTFIT